MLNKCYLSGDELTADLQRAEQKIEELEQELLDSNSDEIQAGLGLRGLGSVVESVDELTRAGRALQTHDDLNKRLGLNAIHKTTSDIEKITNPGGLASIMKMAEAGVPRSTVPAAGVGLASLAGVANGAGNTTEE